MKRKGRSGYIHTYGVQHHERAQRVTHSVEALDEGSGAEMRTEGHVRHFEWCRARRPVFFSTLQRFYVFFKTSKRCFPTPATIIFPFRSTPGIGFGFGSD